MHDQPVRSDNIDLLDLMRVAGMEVVEAIVKWRRRLVTDSPPFKRTHSFPSVPQNHDLFTAARYCVHKTAPAATFADRVNCLGAGCLPAIYVERRQLIA